MTGHNAFIAAVLLTVACAAAAAEPQLVRAEAGGRVVAEAPDGQRVWMVKTGGAHAPRVSVEPSGLLLVDGTMVVDASGRIVERRAPGARRSDAPRAEASRNLLTTARGLAAEPAGAGLVQWEPPVHFGVSATPFFEEPAFDADGNAWVFVTDLPGEGDEVVPIRSVGHTNTWEVQPAIGSGGDILDGAVVRDPDHRISVVYRRIDDAMSHMDVVRYSTATGWTAPETILSTEEFFQNVSAGADADGNLVVGYDRHGNTMYSLVYDAAAGAWSTPQRLSPEGAVDVRAATIVQNAAGTAVYALFFVTDPGFSGVYVSRFDRTTVSWRPARRLPGSRGGDVPGGDGTGSKIPAAVDGEGTLTTFFYRTWPVGGGETLWVLFGSRVAADGTMGVPVPVYLHFEPGVVEFLNAADAEASETGDVLFVFGRSFENLDGSVFLAQLTAVHYDAESGGWNRPHAVYREDGGSFSRSPVAFRSGDSAVVTFTDHNAEPDRLTSRLFDGVSWATQKLDVSSDTVHLTHDMASEDGDVVLWINDPGPYGSWLLESDANFSQ